ncbi:MAG: NepR family anti-sigma factor [Croceibacterium sp.]
MAGIKKSAAKPAKGKAPGTKRDGADWTSGLKQLYDSVVDEPIPDAFKDLLAKLDSGKK